MVATNSLVLCIWSSRTLNGHTLQAYTTLSILAKPGNFREREREWKSWNKENSQLLGLRHFKVITHRTMCLVCSLGIWPNGKLLVFGPGIFVAILIAWHLSHSLPTPWRGSRDLLDCWSDQTIPLSFAPVYYANKQSMFGYHAWYYHLIKM